MPRPSRFIIGASDNHNTPRQLAPNEASPAGARTYLRPESPGKKTPNGIDGPDRPGRPLSHSPTQLSALPRAATRRLPSTHTGPGGPPRPGKSGAQWVLGPPSPSGLTGPETQPRGWVRYDESESARKSRRPRLARRARARAESPRRPGAPPELLYAAPHRPCSTHPHDARPGPVRAVSARKHCGRPGPALWPAARPSSWQDTPGPGPITGSWLPAAARTRGDTQCGRQGSNPRPDGRRADSDDRADLKQAT
jgi:hypothetical protein